MKIGIGISAGTAVVCAALVVEESDGTQSVEYRTVSADRERNSDVGDLVASAIDLMVSLAPSQPRTTGQRNLPTAIAVSYRGAEQASRIRSALAHSRRAVQLVPEADASHAFLDHSGLIARYDSVAIVDIGAAGTTVSIIEPRTGHVHADDRTTDFGGNVIDQVVKDLVHGVAKDRARGKGSSRYRAVKEQLSTNELAEVAGLDAAPVERSTFDDVLRPHTVAAASFTARTAANTDRSLNAVVLIGGGAHIPAVRTEFDRTLSVPVLAIPDPDTVLAIGAARLALRADTGTAAYPTAGTFAQHGAGTGNRSVGRYAGAVLAAFVAGGIVLAYGVQTLVPGENTDVSPVGTAVPNADNGSEVQQPVSDMQHPVPDEAASAPGSRASSTGDEFEPSSPPRVSPTPTRPATTPTLHPAPDLPVIPWPAAPSASRLAPDPGVPGGISPTTTAPDTSGRPGAAAPGESDPSPTDSNPQPPTETPPPDSTTSPDGSTDLPPTEGSTAPPVTPAPETTDSAPPATQPTTNDTPTPTLTPPTTVWAPPTPPQSSETQSSETQSSETQSSEPTG